jgi:hypothetical protein
MIVLEDLDRAFPKTGETKSRVSLQQFLNCLDGVGTGEGIIVVATANESSILDAILRRPGRFDRVIHFADPDFESRQSYFRRMHPAFETQYGWTRSPRNRKGSRLLNCGKHILRRANEFSSARTRSRKRTSLGGFVRCARAFSLTQREAIMPGFTPFFRSKPPYETCRALCSRI